MIQCGMQYRNRIIFCHIDFVQDSKSSKFRALVDGAFPKANLIIYKGIRSNQIGTVCIYMKRNVVFRSSGLLFVNLPIICIFA